MLYCFHNFTISEGYDMKGKINAITNILFYIGLGLFFLFHIVPVLMNIFFSVIDYGKKIRFLGLQHYILLFKDKLFITAFSNNIIFFSSNPDISNLLISDFMKDSFFCSPSRLYNCQ